jgi:membrane protease YdiL (CAAX protease family)
MFNKPVVFYYLISYNFLMKYIIVILSLFIIGVLGRFLDSQSPEGPIGQLIWIILPALLAIYYIKKDNINIGLFKPKFNYLFLSLAIIDITVINLILIHLINPLKFNNWNINWSFVASSVIGLLITVSLEELIWRGYLQNKIEESGTNWQISGILVGLAWYAWQLPYIAIKVNQYVPTIDANSPLLYLNTFLSIITISLMLSFFRKYNNSIIIPIIFHWVYNVLALILINSKILNNTIISSPAVFSSSFVLSSLIMLVLLVVLLPRLLPIKSIQNLT